MKRLPLLTLLCVLSSVLVMGTLISSCKHEPFVSYQVIDSTGFETTDTSTYFDLPDSIALTITQSCDSSKVYFNKTILPLITSRCSMGGCHDGTGKEDNETLDLLMTYGQIVSMVNKTNPTKSKLYTELKDMPPDSHIKISDAEKALILKWIQQGALNNRCDDGGDTTNVTYSKTILPIFQNACVGCHHQSNSANTTIMFDTYDHILAYARSLKLAGSIRNAPGYEAMPPYGKLGQGDITQIQYWLRHGAPNN